MTSPGQVFTNGGFVTPYEYESSMKSGFNDLSRAANSLPGYSQLRSQYYKVNSDEAPNYMDEFDDRVGGLPTGENMPGWAMDENGNYGPIGASQLAQFGEGAYELFDKFVPGMEYIAENQGVSEGELSNRLGEGSSSYQSNIDNQLDQQERHLGRMGIDPTSGAYTDNMGNMRMSAAAGQSANQQGILKNARTEDWEQRLSAAGIGLNVAGQGTNALNVATGAYSDAMGMYGDMYGDYVGGIGNMANLTENARQYNYSQAGDLAKGLTTAIPTMNNTGYGGYLNGVGTAAQDASV
ncbi:MAG: hypothetical protein DRQ89_13465 [Epsilonproteobacteria bacterium]|nr:MAG: hypothetical protein DRQ89_13465 [Campylobacterota bacterium]